MIVDDSHSVWAQHSHNLVGVGQAGVGAVWSEGGATARAADRRCLVHLVRVCLPACTLRIALPQAPGLPAPVHAANRWLWSATFTSRPPGPRWASRAPPCWMRRGEGWLLCGTRQRAQHGAGTCCVRFAARVHPCRPAAEQLNLVAPALQRRASRAGHAHGGDAGTVRWPV